MKKSYLVMAAAAALFAACSSNDLAEEKSPQTTQPTDEQVVGFEAYVNRGLTRAGVDGPITTTELKSTTADAGKAGFGVFGYYTDGERYSGITKPNFFYNQQVKWDGTNWTYSPIKYWPNEFGSDAISDQVDRVSLFAYLPYVKVDPLTGVVTEDQETNIIGMSRNNVTGDPFIKYVATMDAKNSVDLCYGVAADNFTSSNSSLNQNKIKKGEPYIDVVKPGIDANSKIKFDFKHATAQLKVKVDAIVNSAEKPSATGVQADYTRIWIRSVTFEGVTLKGSLNLNGGEWYDINGTNKITTGSIVLYDGRKDGKEAILAATNEIPSSINPKLIQSVPYTLNDDGKITAPDASTGPGVTTNPYNLFVNSGTEDPIFVIPTGEKMKVTIVYDVETVDPNLAYYLSDGSTQGSTIENSISKTIETFGDIKAGYCYTLNLHLGMRTVDFDAVVTEWQDQQANVDLPSNLQTFAAGNPITSGTITLPYNTTAYDFAVSGLIPNHTTSGNAFTINSANPTVVFGSADASGIAKINVTNIASNTSTKSTSGTWHVSDGTNAINLTATLLAAPLGLVIEAQTSNKIVQIKSTIAAKANALNTDLTQDADHIKVFRNGTQLVFGTEFTYSLTGSYNGVITFTDAPNVGDNIKIWIQSGEAPAESISHTWE